MADDRTDLEISVDYGDSPGDPEIVTGNAWARFLDTNTKCFICSESVTKNGDPETEIVNALNNDDVFADGIQKYLAFFADFRENC